MLRRLPPRTRFWPSFNLANGASLFEYGYTRNGNLGEAPLIKLIRVGVGGLTWASSYLAALAKSRVWPYVVGWNGAEEGPQTHVNMGIPTLAFSTTILPFHSKVLNHRTSRVSN